MTSLVDKVYDNIRKNSLLPRGSRILVAVSGGADSVALLEVFKALRHNMGISIIVAHYNHALRVSAVKDQKFVEQLAGKFGFPFVTETNRTKRPQKGSLEEFARNIRYDFLLRTARRLTRTNRCRANTRSITTAITAGPTTGRATPCGA